MRRAHLFSRRASALVVALGVLLVLAVLAISFARLTAIEGQAASVRVDEVRARFLAFAGIERVLAEVRAASRAPWDGPDAAWFYRGEPGRPAGNGTPLEFASLPSFFAGNTVDGNPEIAANGNGRPYSGALPTSYETLGDTYVVKVLDAASMIDLNAPLDPRRRVADEPLVSMLVNLSRALDPARPPLDSSEAQMILAYRESLPFRRFASKKDILLVPGGPVTPAEFALLADFVTVHAWADPSGVAPADPALVPVEGTPVLGRRPTGRPLAQRRRPVDLNTAPPEVLAAVLAGVQAVVVDQDVDREPAGGISWQATGIAARTPPVSFGQAQSLARAIVAHREASPFRTWSEFRSFLAQMVDDGAVERLQADAIYANADPNPDTHRANPDAGVYRHIDKFDLVQSTTEFCFSSMGVFEIESIGRVTQNGGLIEAEAWIGTVVETHVLVRETTQSQFDRGTISTYRLEEPIFFSPQVAVITEEDLRINGSPRILGAAGSVHSNANLELLGSTLVEIDATATGTYEQGPQCQVLGESGGGYPREIIPLLRPSDFRASADYVFSASGKVYDRSGREVGDGRYLDFRFQAGTWKWNGGQQPTGTLWFDGHVEIQARTGRGSTWEVTIVATGHISLGGTPRVRPTEVSRLTLIAGTDVSVSGNPGAVIEGLLYAGEQIDLGGNVEFRGVAMAKGLGATDRLVTGNVIQGSVIFRYNGGLVFQSETVVTNLPTLRAHPEPDAEVELGGPRVRIPGAQDFDGWISLATATTSRAVLGPTPY
ncbi:MAG: hypothetical protein HY720_30105, partial [Planctomycetes bacterium]|nr:hypothetical protein [Planctomycetota bacterium]